MKSSWPAICCAALLSACATSRPDHFYILTAQPPGVAESRAAPSTAITLKMTVPAVVDRPEMVLNTSADAVMVLEHERWAAPLPDLMVQTLGRDLERRRNDLIVVDRGFDRPGSPSVKITVEILQLSLRQGGAATLEAHWRVVDPRSGTDLLGSNVVHSPLANNGYAAVAQALSECLGLLADSLVTKLPAA